MATAKRNMRTAFVLAGVPWLAYFATRALPLVGHVTAYSWDDWLAYQLAGSRIYMHGYWLEGGTRTFDYQALYRWLSGALHLIFGDSSVGETFVDAFCLLAGSLVAFALVRPVAGFRAALLACTGTLATFTLGTPWYFVGRGLSEIAAAGLCHRLAPASSAAHASLIALLLPLSVPIDARAIAAGVRRVHVAAAAMYTAVFVAGVALLAARTWWYTGVFSLLYGTSLKNNDTGLRLTTIASAEPWRKIAHSLGALVWMNEPPRPDPRSLLVAAGVLAAVAALCQVPRLRELPASIVVVVIGSTLSSFLAHTHGYPGRMSIHLIPFAVSAAAIATARIVHAGHAPTP